MKYPNSLLMIATGLLALPAAGRADDVLPGLFGRIQGDKYIGPGAVYSVTMPVLPELGGEVHDTESVVTFDDNVSTHISVACFPLDAAQKVELDSRGTKDFLADFYTRFVLQDFQTRFPGTSAEATLFTPSLLDGALFGYSLLPGGSFFPSQDDITGTPAEKPPVAKRGNLLFVKNGYVFVVSIELAERITQRKVFNKTPEQENEILRDRLVQMVGRIHFPASKPSRQP